MVMSMLTVAKRPCGSCPYRRDVPSGIWSQNEYDKLPSYDGETWEQAFNGGLPRFDCHQRDGNLCAGWLACHGPTELLAMRVADSMGEGVDPEVWGYKTDVPVFSSGAEAREHGIRDIDDPGPAARRMISGLEKKREFSR